MTCVSVTPQLRGSGSCGSGCPLQATPGQVSLAIEFPGGRGGGLSSLDHLHPLCRDTAVFQGPHTLGFGFGPRKPCLDNEKLGSDGEDFCARSHWCLGSRRELAREARRATFSHMWAPLATGTGSFPRTALGGRGRAGTQGPPSEDGGRLPGQEGEEEGGGGPQTDLPGSWAEGAPGGGRGGGWEEPSLLLDTDSEAAHGPLFSSFIPAMRARLEGFPSEKLRHLSHNPEVPANPIKSVILIRKHCETLKTH